MEKHAGRKQVAENTEGLHESALNFAAWLIDNPRTSRCVLMNVIAHEVGHHQVDSDWKKKSDLSTLNY